MCRSSVIRGVHSEPRLSISDITKNLILLGFHLKKSLEGGLGMAASIISMHTLLYCIVLVHITDFDHRVQNSVEALFRQVHHEPRLKVNNITRYDMDFIWTSCLKGAVINLNARCSKLENIRV